jgi:hypothetical protein
VLYFLSRPSWRDFVSRDDTGSDQRVRGALEVGLSQSVVVVGVVAFE